MGGRPVLDYLIERLQAAGCEDIRIVTRPEKHDLLEHVRAAGLTAVEARPASVAESLLCGAGELDEDDVVLFGFPDSVWEPVDGFSRLFSELGQGIDAAVGVFRSAVPEESDVVELDDDGRLLRIDVKPVAPCSDLIWGCAAVKGSALGGLTAHHEPGLWLDELAREGRVRAVAFGTEFVDVGTPAGLERARTLEQVAS